MVNDDIEFRTIDGEPLLGRLYRPRDGRCVAAVIDVHGGGWVGADRLDNAVIDQTLAEHGVAVFAIDFRMPPKAPFPAALEDVNYAIRWLKANAGRLGLETPAIGGLGTSSGGHLLLVNALQPELYAPVEPALRVVDATLDFVVAAWPVADPLARYRMVKERGVQHLIDAHHSFWPDEAAMMRVNPQGMLDRDETVVLPPMLVLQGTADHNLDHTRSDVFAASYRRRGGAVELVKFDGAPHSFIAREPRSDAAQEGLRRIVEFVTG